MGRLEGKVAIITGAARGQGAAEARAFVAEGARVVLTDIDPAGIDVAEKIGEHAIFISHDVSDRQSWKNVVHRAVARFGKLNILVNNAGIYRPGSIGETDEALLDLHHNINVKGAFLGIAEVAEHMAAAGGGSIINTSSITGLRGYAGILAYGTSKWAVRGMTRCAAAELAPHRIRVNSIHPGLIDTPMIATNSAEFNEAAVAATPLGRIGLVDDVAALATFLASDESSYITGAAMPVDGGYIC